jgi:hypothetical protein
MSLLRCSLAELAAEDVVVLRDEASWAARRCVGTWRRDDRAAEATRDELPTRCAPSRR